MGFRSYRGSCSSSSSFDRDSAHTQSTTPTSFSDRPPMLKYNASSPPPSHLDGDDDRRASVDTYASTVPSAEDLREMPSYEVPKERHKRFSSDAIPSTPPDFAQLFPSSRRLLIRHDDSTSDGNMNLRVDTEISTSKRKFKMTLFHLRMRDLNDRQFSLRRYCRESGREICHSSRKYKKPSRPQPSQRPVVLHSISHTLQAIIPYSLRRQDLRAHPEIIEDDDESDSLRQFTGLSDVKATIPTNTVRLEFSNYAQVELHRHRLHHEKTWDFEYWGHSYSWQRSTTRSHNQQLMSYHLIDLNEDKTVAHITPDRLTRSEAFEEEYQGGWVPPSSMVLNDPSISEDAKTDLADVIVATGLIALVDDCIKRHWHSTQNIQLCIPNKTSSDYAEPHHLIDKMFNRPGHRSHGQTT